MQGGSWRLLGVQLLACVVTAAWGVITTVILLYAIEKTIGIRLTREEEQQGCDLVEHGIGEEDEDEDGDKGEVDRDAQTKRESAFRRSTLTEVERFSGEGATASGERKFTGGFVMRLPFIARALRRKKRGELSAVKPTHVESSANARKNDEDPRTPDDSSPPRVMSAREIRRGNDDTRVSDDLRSICSVETDIEELLRRDGESSSESCYVMNAKMRTMDKCTQVTCEQGVLFEL